MYSDCGLSMKTNERHGSCHMSCLQEYCHERSSAKAESTTTTTRTTERTRAHHQTTGDHQDTPQRDTAADHTETTRHRGQRPAADPTRRPPGHHGQNACRKYINLPRGGTQSPKPSLQRLGWPHIPLGGLSPKPDTLDPTPQHGEAASAGRERDRDRPGRPRTPRTIRRERESEREREHH